MPQPVVTFDLFSALLDSRTGGAHAFGRLGRRRGWAVDGETVYDRWDALNKGAQRDCHDWVPFRALSRQALAATYAELGLDGDPDRDVREVVGSMAQWPPWPDVDETMRRYVRTGGIAGHRIGLLSNVDDDIFLTTRVAGLVDPEVALTSQRLGAYKPDPRIYTRAQERLAGRMVHVASSARDVRGALEAGCPTVRLRRPGHHLDPGGPRPAYEVGDVRELAAVLPSLGL